MSVEQELKLHVQAASRQAVKEIIDTATAKTIHLHAFYFDTCTREIAQAGIALRLRKEDGIWIQTIKLPGDDALSKIEYNHPRPDATLDLSVYESTPAKQAFSQLKNELVARFETDIYRTLRLEETPYGVIELAYDNGYIRSAQLEIPVCELELELKEGSSAAIFTMANTWQRQHQFMLDFRSKAERGDALASAAIDSKRIDTDFKLWQPWHIDMDSAELSALSIKQAIQLYLEQAARNAAIIAGIDRVDIKGALSLEISQHINQLCSALQRIQQLYANTDKQSKERLIALQQYHGEFSQASPVEAKELAGSIDFQACLLEILTWTIVKA